MVSPSSTSLASPKVWVTTAPTYLSLIHIFYGWGGDENRNNWLNTTVADHVKENYGITLEVVGMDINDILTKLSGEKQAGSEKGSIDMIWINGENFYSAKDNGLLYLSLIHISGLLLWAGLKDMYPAPAP